MGAGQHEVVMKSLVIDMVKKAPAPDKMGAYGDDPAEESTEAEPEQDEDADTASAESAFSDYIKAVKSGDVKEGLALFKELVGHCK